MDNSKSASELFIEWQEKRNKLIEKGKASLDGLLNSIREQQNEISRLLGELSSEKKD
jgi:hypothetical protein